MQFQGPCAGLSLLPVTWGAVPYMLKLAMLILETVQEGNPGRSS